MSFITETLNFIFKNINIILLILISLIIAAAALFDQKTLNFIFKNIDIISLIIAAVALFDQIRRYRKDKRDSRLSSIRSSLIKCQSTLNYLDNKFNTRITNIDIHGLVIMFSFSVADKFCDYLKDIRSKEKLKSTLKDENKMFFLYLALIQSCNQSHIRREILEEIYNVKVLLFNHQSDMPILIGIITQCLQLLERVILFSTTVILYRDSDDLQTDNHFLAKALNELEEYNEQTIKQKIALQIEKELKSVFENELLPMFQSVKGIIDVLINLMIRIKPSQLKDLIDWDNSTFYEIKKEDDPMRDLVNNWIAYKKAKKTDPEFQFKLGCVQLRRILNYIYELEEDIEALEKIINQYPEDLSLSVGTSERDNIRRKNKLF